jgi:excisionase family DNA binding protein
MQTNTLDRDERWAMSVPEAGRRLAISRAHAYRLVASGELPSLRLGHRTVVPVSVLQAMLAESLLASGRRRGGPVDTSGASASGHLGGSGQTVAGDGEGRSC